MTCDRRKIRPTSKLAVFIFQGFKLLPEPQHAYCHLKYYCYIFLLPRQDAPTALFAYSVCK